MRWQPQIDWREALREFIQNTCAGSDYSTYARPNRRLMSQGIYMPTGISQQVGELVIAVDTSGSIQRADLTAFLSEVKSICDTTGYMAENHIHPQACIVLTDGDLYRGWGQWDCPVLWTILNNKCAVPDIGKAVHIKSGDM